MSDRTYFRVDPDSPAMKVIEEAEVKQREFYRVLRELKAEFGAKEVWTSGRECFSGFTFERGRAPSGFRTRQDGRSVPDRREKAGRELAKRFESLPHGVSALQLSDMFSRAFGEGYTDWEAVNDDGQHFWAATVYERWGDAVILSVPSGLKRHPPGCTELKMSEYWAIREAHEAKKESEDTAA